MDKFTIEQWPSEEIALRIIVPVTLRQLEAGKVELEGVWGIDAKERNHLLDDPGILRIVTDFSVYDKNLDGYTYVQVLSITLPDHEPKWCDCMRRYRKFNPTHDNVINEARARSLVQDILGWDTWWEAREKARALYALNYSYDLVCHPQSGETYALHLRGQEIIGICGPLSQEDRAYAAEHGLDWLEYDVEDNEWAANIQWRPSPEKQL